MQDGWDKFPWLIDLSWDHSFDPLLRGLGGLERTMTAARGVPAGWRQDVHAHYHPAKQKVLGHSGEGVLASTRETPGSSVGAWSCCQVVLTRPDPGCATYLTLFVSQSHYLKSGDNNGT